MKIKPARKGINDNISAERSSGEHRKSILSIEDPVRDMMDMYYGGPREQV